MIINPMICIGPAFGKGEVECSIHSGSTIKAFEIMAFCSPAKSHRGNSMQNDTETRPQQS